MLKFLYKGNYGRFALASSLSILKSLLIVFFISATGQFISQNEAKLTVLHMAIAFSLIVLFFLLNSTSGVVLSRLNIAVISDMRKRLISELLRIDYNKREALGSNRIYSALTADLSNLANFTSVSPLLIYNAFLVTISIAYLFYLSPALTLTLIGTTAVSITIFGIFANKGHKAFAKMAQLRERVFRNYNVLEHAAKELTLNGNRKQFFYHRQVIPSIDKLDKSERQANFYWIFSHSIVLTILLITLIAIVYVGKNIFLLGTTDLMQYTLVILFIVGPVDFLLQSFSTASQAVNSYKKIEELQLDLNSDFEFLKESRKLGFQLLELSDLYFHYPSQNNEEGFAVGPMSLTFSASSVVFITGGNGSGKSTLLKIILGLVEHSTGELKLDNRTINSENLPWYRRHFSCIFQDFYLFDSILDSAGDLADDRESNPLIADLDLARKVKADNGVLSTTSLSQGQRRRLALILALFEDSPIFVFDEWAADQDSTFKHYFYYDLLPQLKKRGKLVIAVTHDEQYFSCCDTLVRLDQGKIVHPVETSPTVKPPQYEPLL